jgi:hypothetical protein
MGNSVPFHGPAARHELRPIYLCRSQLGIWSIDNIEELVCPYPIPIASREAISDFAHAHPFARLIPGCLRRTYID